MQQLPDGWVPGEPWRAHVRCMIVGEAPGAAEWKSKRPFVGPAGQFLRDELRAAGLDPDNAYITNVVKIWPQDGHGKTRSPTVQEIGAAIPYLVEELRYVNPRHILALGGTAYQALTGSKKKIGVARGPGARWPPGSRQTPLSCRLTTRRGLETDPTADLRSASGDSI